MKYKSTIKVLVNRMLEIMFIDCLHCFVPISCHIQDGEMIIKTWNDCWVVCKKADQREVYIILNQKNANLIEINGK